MFGGADHDPQVTFVTAATLPPMSDHTERLAKISERVSAAKEFL
jgi:hypothetical protein